MAPSTVAGLRPVTTRPHGATRWRRSLTARDTAETVWSARIDVVVNSMFGLLWYRMIFVHRPVGARAVDDVAAALATQLGANQEG